MKERIMKEEPTIVSIQEWLFYLIVSIIIVILILGIVSSYQLIRKHATQDIIHEKMITLQIDDLNVASDSIKQTIEDYFKNGKSFIDGLELKMDFQHYRSERGLFYALLYNRLLPEANPECEVDTLIKEISKFGIFGYNILPQCFVGESRFNEIYKSEKITSTLGVKVINELEQFDQLTKLVEKLEQKMEELRTQKLNLEKNQGNHSKANLDLPFFYFSKSILQTLIMTD